MSIYHIGTQRYVGIEFCLHARARPAQWLRQRGRRLLFSAICASDRLRLGVSVEDNADAADDDDGEDEEDTVSVD